MNKKNVLILGANSSIAKSLNTILDKNTFHIINHYRKKDPVHEKNSIYLDINEFNIKDIRNLINTDLDGIVFMLGKTHYSFFKDIQYNDWQSMFNTNVIFPALILKELEPVVSDNCSVIFLGSYLANIGEIGMTHYVSAKSALKGLVKSLAKEFSHKKVRVNLIEPHLIMTQNTKNIPNKIKNKYIQDNLLKRIGEPEDIAEMIAFLLSEKSSYINAEIIAITGGKKD